MQPEMREEMRISFRPKLINHSTCMLIEGLERWHQWFQYNDTLGNGDNMLLSCLLLDKYILSLICIARINFSEQPHIKGKARDAVRSPFRAIHINESKIVVDLVRWHHYSITLKKNQRYYVYVTVVVWFFDVIIASH